MERLEPLEIATTAVADFDGFYAREYPRVARLLFGLLGKWPVSEELAQEALLAAHQHWERVGQLERPDLWLRHVAMNRAISTHRRWLAEAAAITRIRVASAAPAVDAVDERVWRAVRRLPKRQAAALLLWAVEDRTHAEIGGTLGCSEETARTHVRRAREALRHELGERDT